MSPDEMMEKYGWVIHLVYETDQNEFNGLSNTHTHGLAENFGHPDIQIVFPLDPNTIQTILTGVVERISDGETLEAGQISDKVLQGMNVSFKEFQEGDRTVLRLLLPDPNGKLPGDNGCDPHYNRQLEELPDDKSK